MAVTTRTRLYELLVRMDYTPDGDRIRGMQVRPILEYLTDDVVTDARIGEATNVTMTEVAALMHPDDLAELAAAVTLALGP